MGLGKIAVVVGVGSGLGGEVAKRFAAGGFSVALVSRRVESAQGTLDQITKSGGKAAIVTADTGKEADVKRAYKEIVDKFKASPEVLIYNTGGGQVKSWPPPKLLDLDPAAFQATFQAGVTGGLLWTQQVAPEQIAAGKGTIIFTGATAALRGGAGFAMLSAHKFALRSLAQTAARELQDKGIHVAFVIVDGVIKPKGKITEPVMLERPDERFVHPEDLAETYFQLYSQKRSAWTQELDVRPFSEKW